MPLGLIIGLTLLWQFCGFGIDFCWVHQKCCDGWELCNPYWAHRYHKSVNWFGAIILSLAFTTLCPVGAICYWFYKLCTIGRR